MGSYEPLIPDTLKGEDDASGATPQPQNPFIMSRGGSLRQGQGAASQPGGGGSSQQGTGGVGSKKRVDFGEYMHDKVLKLRQEGAARGHKAGVDLIFKGVCIWADGFTNPPLMELRKLVEDYGGKFEQYTSSLVTHIIADQLAEAHVSRYNKMVRHPPIVRAEWVTESIRQNRLLDTAGFRHPRIGTLEKQGTLDGRGWLSQRASPREPRGVRDARVQGKVELSELVFQGRGGEVWDATRGREEGDAARPQEGYATRVGAKRAREEVWDGEGGAVNFARVGEDWTECLSLARVDAKWQEGSEGSSEAAHGAAQQPPQTMAAPGGEEREQRQAAGAQGLAVVLQVQDFMLAASFPGYAEERPTAGRSPSAPCGPAAAVATSRMMKAGKGRKGNGGNGDGHSVEEWSEHAKRAFEDDEIVLEANVGAAAAGVECGMSSQAAHACCPGIVLVPVDFGACARMARRLNSVAQAQGFVVEEGGVRGGEMCLRMAEERGALDVDRVRVEEIAAALEGLRKAVTDACGGARVAIGAGKVWAEAWDAKREVDCLEAVRVLAQRCAECASDEGRGGIGDGARRGETLVGLNPGMAHTGPEEGEGDPSADPEAVLMHSAQQTSGSGSAAPPSHDRDAAQRPTGRLATGDHHIPTMSQVDPSVLSELPEAIRTDLVQALEARSRQQGLPARAGPASSRVGSSGAGGRAGKAKASGSTGKARGGAGKGGAGSAKRPKFFQSAGTDPPAAPGLDPAALKSLTESMGAEWVRDNVMNTPQFRRSGGLEDGCVRQAAVEEHRGLSGDDRTAALAVGQGQQAAGGSLRGPIECGEVTGLRRAVRDWISASERPLPIHEEALCRILDMAIRSERRLDVAACLMKLLRRRGSEAAEWKGVVERVIDFGQKSVHRGWGGLIAL